MGKCSNSAGCLSVRSRQTTISLPLREAAGASRAGICGVNLSLPDRAHTRARHAFSFGLSATASRSTPKIWGRVLANVSA